jgi:hypothetical protein
VRLTLGSWRRGSGVRGRRSLLLLLTYVYISISRVRGVLYWFHLLGLWGVGGVGLYSDPSFFMISVGLV